MKNDLLTNLMERKYQQGNLACDAQSKYNNFVNRFFRDLNDERSLASRMDKIGNALVNKVEVTGGDAVKDQVKRKSRF